MRNDDGEHITAAIFMALTLAGIIAMILHETTKVPCIDTAEVSTSPQGHCADDDHQMHVRPVPSGGFLVNCVCHKADVVPVFIP